jgi:Ca-activated chloride channel homolog
MKSALLAIGLATGLTVDLSAGETLRLNIEPERDWLLAGSPQEVVVKIDLAAAAAKEKHRRAPLNLAVVLDRSGSMGGAKIEKARQAAMEVVDRLAPDDLFSLITYSDRAEVIVPAQKVEDKDRMKALISRIHANGSTALYAGVQTGATEVDRHLCAQNINRVILLSDGLANVGPSSTHDLQNLGRQLSERGIAVTTIGVGDDYNEDLMAGLAQASDANYYYVKDSEKLPQIFARELGELQTVAAREIEIEIICPDGVKPLRLLGRSEKFSDQRAKVRLSALTAEQERYLLLLCRVETGKPEIAEVRVNYRDEVNGGADRSVRATARIRFTKDSEIVAKSVRTTVVTQKELLLTAIAKDEALADADAGNFQRAAQTLASQATALDAQYQNAPASLQIQIKQEVQNLRDRSNQLQNNRYDPATRKTLQSESWTVRNSK